VSLRARLIAILCTTAAIATALALLFQDRTLAHDLEQAAAARLERSAAAANRLADAHLASLSERYRAISGTPQLRANLEVEDPPTLAHYAEDLRQRSGADRLAFVDLHGRLLAASGSEPADAALIDDPRPRLLARNGQLLAVVSVEIGTGDDVVGRLYAVEPISAGTLAGWGELCGAPVVLAFEPRNDGDTLSLPVRAVGNTWLRVESKLDAERQALRRSRALLFAAGLIALAGALGASLILSRTLVGAMHELLHAAERIGKGDFAVRLSISRDDEVGEVAGAVNEMAERLEANAAALRAQHAELVVAKERAEAASRAKTEFLANMSHEIRTPMTAVLGYSDLLLGGEGDKSEREAWAAAVRANGERLLDLIDGILDVSRLEADRLAIEPRACALREIVAQAATMVRETALAKGLAFTCELGAECPEAIETDPLRLRQILSSLLRNAVKFTSTGAVRLRVGRAAGSQSRLVFEVIDSGLGISAHDVERIFAPFGQVDTSHTRRFGGAGLGLAISRRLAALLGGSLGVTSEPGRGSTFRLEIEAPAVALPPPSPEFEATRPRADRPARVLVAEDGPDNQRLIRALLRAAGAEVHLVENGAQALARAQVALDAGDHYDLVLMDMQMPVMDGYEATRRLREGGYTAPIVALTAHAMSGDRERCLAAGCDDYLTKPIDRAQLVQCVARFTSESKPDPEDATR
jgi:signal transduction histidine kinase/ActR/RegA family two-component response regulator